MNTVATLAVLSGLCWTIVYVDCLRLGIKQRTYAMPWAFRSYLTPSDLHSVSGADFAAYAVVAVFAGAKGASGHEIEIQGVRVDAAELVVTARITGPVAGDYGLTAFFTPYHVVALPKAALGIVPPASWALYDLEGKKTAGGRF